MALIFCDGFDHYGSDDILKKWDDGTLSYIGQSCTIDNSNQRTGTGCLKIYYTASGGYPPFNVKKFISNKQTIVTGFAIKFTKWQGASSICMQVCLYDNKTLQTEVKIDLNKKINIYRGTTLLGTSTDSLCSLDEWIYLETKTYIHDTEGYVTVRKNGEVFYELTGIDTKNSSNAYCDKVLFGTMGYSVGVYIDDLYIDDAEFHGDIKVETLYPSGAGTTKQWDASAGDNYECVDETPLNSDTDYISTSTADEIDTYALGNLTTTAGTIHGVQVNMVARKDDAGSRSIAPVVRPASTDRIGTTVSIGDSYMDYMQMYTVNPEDSEAWTIEDVNGAEFGIKCIS